MPFPQLIVLWALLAVIMVLLGLRQGKKFDAGLIGLVVLTATILTGLTAIYPVAEKPNLLGVAVGWVRNFLVYTILLSVVSKVSFKQSAASGFVFASILVLFDLL